MFHSLNPFNVVAQHHLSVLSQKKIRIYFLTLSSPGGHFQHQNLLLVLFKCSSLNPSTIFKSKSEFKSKVLQEAQGRFQPVHRNGVASFCVTEEGLSLPHVYRHHTVTLQHCCLYAISHSGQGLQGSAHLYETRFFVKPCWDPLDCHSRSPKSNCPGCQVSSCWKNIAFSIPTV